MFFVQSQINHVWLIWTHFYKQCKNEREDFLMCLSRFSSSKRVAALAGIAVCLASYAGSPVASEKIAVAKASVQRAEQAGAPQAAPVELAAAYRSSVMK